MLMYRRVLYYIDIYTYIFILFLLVRGGGFVLVAYTTEMTLLKVTNPVSPPLSHERNIFRLVL